MTVADLIEDLKKRPPLERVYFYRPGDGMSESAFEECAGWRGIEYVAAHNPPGMGNITALVAEVDF